MKATITVSSKIVKTPRAMQLVGLFDIPPMDRSEIRWDVSLPIEDKPWNIGLIVGPSGSGKSTVARKLFADNMAPEFPWPKDKSIVDAFPKAMGIKEIVELLSSVGFSSPPSWLRPFHVLSNGEQFRVTMARLLAETPGIAVVDEFTSVVDRTVAHIGSAAIAKTVRRRKQQFVAVTCHEDVQDWLQPDWVYRPAERVFAWRELRRRPEIEVEIYRVHRQAWRLFKDHHYLSSQLHPTAHCFVASINGRPAVFSSWMPLAGLASIFREHRTVTLPDFQGVGLGIRISELIASALRGLGRRARSTTSHPAMIHGRLNRPAFWRAETLSQFGRKDRRADLSRTRALTRWVSAFEYVGPAMDYQSAGRLFDVTAIFRDLLRRYSGATVSLLKRKTMLSETCVRNALADLESAGEIERKHSGVLSFSLAPTRQVHPAPQTTIASPDTAPAS